jgi:hypothetical protein
MFVESGLVLLGLTWLRAEENMRDSISEIGDANVMDVDPWL